MKQFCFLKIIRVTRDGSEIRLILRHCEGLISGRSPHTRLKMLLAHNKQTNRYLGSLFLSNLMSLHYLAVVGDDDSLPQ